jgi:hypothetical protein
MKTPSTLAAAVSVALFALSLVGCAGESAPLPEVRYYAIADT